MDEANRGLSFQQDGPLDMRLDPTAGETAADLIARLSEYDLAKIIYEYGEEHGVAGWHGRSSTRKQVADPHDGTARRSGAKLRAAGKGRSFDPATAFSRRCGSR
jgi:16S rRNA (cytosine1402-N4)-methyltransferase